MTKDEQIRNHYCAIRNAAMSRWGSGSQARVKCIQRHLDAIEKLLQESEPEPKCLATSVLRLTHLCNRLEKENYEQKLKLTQYRAGWFPYDCATDEANVERLREKLDFALASNVWLTKRLTFMDQSLRACRAAAELLEEKLARIAEVLEMEQTKS